MKKHSRKRLILASLLKRDYVPILLMFLLLFEVQGERYAHRHLQDAANNNTAGRVSCPCLSAAQLASTTSFGGAENMPATYGIGCGHHDISAPVCMQSDKCDDSTLLVDCDNAWCHMAWCYVGKIDNAHVQ
jgi:hypothetical protein